MPELPASSIDPTRQKTFTRHRSEPTPEEQIRRDADQSPANLPVYAYKLRSDRPEQARTRFNIQTPQVCPTPDDVTVEMCVWLPQARLLIREPALQDSSTVVRLFIAMYELAL